MKTYDLAISGAGLAGMALALDMARAGQRVLLLERRSNVGGALAGQLTPLGPADNCPHLFLDSFTQCLSRLHSLGSANKLRSLPLTFHIYWKNNWQRIALPERLPPPFALFTGGLPKGFLMGSRWLITARNSDCMTSSQMRASAFEMLSRFQISEDLLEFWREWGLSVFNAPLGQTDAGLFLQTARRLFLKSGAFRPRIATCSLEELWLEPFRKALGDAGVELRTKSSVCDLDVREGKVLGFQMRDGRVSAKRFVWAAPPHGLAQLPSMSESAQEFISPAMYPKRAHAIVHFLCDTQARKVEPGSSVPMKNGRYSEMVGFFGHSFQWLFPAGKDRVSLVGSAVTGDRRGKSDEDLISEGLRLVELAGVSPRGKPVLLRRQHATLLPDAEFEASRPGNQTPHSNLFCCGAWTNTGLPISMESALESASTLAQTLLR